MDEKQLQALYDAMSAKLSLGDYKSFKNNLVSDDKFRKSFYDEASHELELGDYNTFDTNLKKKDGITVSQNGSPISVPSPSTSNQSEGVDVKAEAEKFNQEKANTPFPAIPNIGTETPPDYEGKNPIDLALEADKKSKSTLQGDIATHYGNVPDEKQRADAEKINKYLSDKKYNPKKLVELFGDLPEQAYDVTDENGNKNQTKEKLLEELSSNPIDAQSHIGNIKTQFNLQNQAYNDALDSGTSEHEAQQYGIQLGNAFQELHKQPLHNVDELYQNIEKQKQLVSQYLTGDQRDKALEQIKNSSGKFINANQPSLIEEYEKSDLKNLVTPDEYAGLKTWQLFEPDKYEQAINILKTPLENFKPADTKSYLNGMQPDTPKNKEGNIKRTNTDNVIGEETIHRNLLDAGRNNAIMQLNADQFNLNKAHEQATDDSEKNKIAEQYLANQQKLRDINADAALDDEKYKLTAHLKFDNQVKELSQSAGVNTLEYGANRFTKGLSSAGESIEDILTGIFGSEQDNTRLQMKRMGESQKYESENYLPENLRSTGSPYILKPSKELKAQADEILKGRKISDLSPAEQKNLTDLVANNQDQLETITNPDAGKSKNFLSKSTLYNTAGFTGDVASFMAQTAGLGALGMSSKAAELTTLFDGAYSPAYNQAISEGKSPSQANQYAMLHGGIMVLAGAISSKYDAVKEMLAQAKSPLSKEIAGMGEAAWNKVINNKQGVINKIKNSLKDVATQNAKMIATYGVGTSIVGDLADKGFFNKKISTDEIIKHAVESSKEMAIGGMALAGAGFLMQLAKNPMTLKDKAMLWENGDNPEIGKAKIDEAVLSNKITQQEGDLRKKAIDKMATVIQKVPTLNDRGKPLTDNERIEYGYNLFVKDKAKEAASDLPPKQSEDAEFKGLVLEYTNDIILEKPTDKQLESRKNALEKQLVQKDENGKLVLPEKELIKVKAQLQSVNEAISNKPKTEPSNTNEEALNQTRPQSAADEAALISGRTPQEVDAIVNEPVPAGKLKRQKVTIDEVDPQTQEKTTKEVTAKEGIVAMKKQVGILDLIKDCLTK